MKSFTKLMLIILSIISFTYDASAQFVTGDVFVAVGSGQVQWRKPNGTLVSTLNTGLGGFTTGMALDTANNLYVTGFSANAISKFDDFGTLIGTVGSGYATPESIVFDNAHNFYAGNLGNGMRKYDLAGTFLGTSFAGRVDFMDLESDQCTMLYTQEGTNILRHNVCTNTPMTDFASGLGGNAYALRILTSGEVLLANGVNILRLNSLGSVVQTYDVSGEDSWFALNLDPDGVTFWSADFGTANVYRINIATGAVVSTFNTGTGGSTVFGLAVAGEITVATQLFITLAPHDATNPINTEHCVTATVVDQNGIPQAGENIFFHVTGANGIINGFGVTNGSGQTQFCYTGLITGRDTIIGAIGTTGKQDTAFKTWEGISPVEMSSFTFNIINRDVKLNWTTAAELNNSGFDIERSAVSDQWTKVGTVQGYGTTNEPKNYEFMDRNLNQGKYSYRLKQYDFNGNYHYFTLNDEVVVGIPVRFDLAQNYPNPFNPTTKIDFEIPKDGNVNLTVYDANGRVVSELVNGFKTAGYYSIQFNGSNLSSGIYYYKIRYFGDRTFERVMKMALVK